MTDLDTAGAQRSGPATAAPARRRPTLLIVVAAVSTLVLVAAVVLAVVMALQVRQHDRLERDRADAQAAAQQFALRMDNLRSEHVDSYVSNIEKLLTTKAKAQFKEQFASFKKIYEQASKKAAFKRTGKIVYVGVADADSDSATVLVVHDSTIDGQSQSQHNRWTVSMRKIGDHWLVDDFTPVS